MLKSRNKITTIFTLNTSFDFNADDYLHAFQVQRRLSNNILCHSVSRSSSKEQLKYFLKNYTCLVNLFPPDNLLIKWFIFLNFLFLIFFFFFWWEALKVNYFRWNVLETVFSWKNKIFWKKKERMFWKKHFTVYHRLKQVNISTMFSLYVLILPAITPLPYPISELS